MRKPSARLATKPSKGQSAIYDSKFHPVDLVSHLEAGHFKFEVCAAWGISTATLDKWIVTFKEMAEAYDIGREKFFAFNMALWRGKMMGHSKHKKINSSMLMFQFTNVMGWSHQGGRFEYGSESQNTFELDYEDPDNEK